MKQRIRGWIHTMDRTTPPSTRGAPPSPPSYFSMYMNSVFNPSDRVGCAKIPSSRAV